MSVAPLEMAFDANGLATVVVQDRASGDVLMVAHANAEALRLTVETGFALPGMSCLSVEAVLFRDYPVAQTKVILAAGTLVALILPADGGLTQHP